MPNWVYGQLCVTGDKKELQKFKEFAEGEETFYDDDFGKGVNTQKYILDMNKFIPYPKKFKEIDKKAYDYNINIKELQKKSETDKEAKEEYERLLVLQELEKDGSRDILWKPDGFNSGGYEWCVRNWGTKWNFGDVSLREENNELNYSFQTAWSIPMPVLFKMSKMFPSLTFSYYGDEESEAFETEIEFKAGKIVSEETKGWEDIQIDRITEGEIDDCYEEDVNEELRKHKGHEIIHSKNENAFRCNTCNKIIWNLK